MTNETRREKILASISHIRDKKKELVHEGKKLYDQDVLTDHDVRSLGILYKEYKRQELNEEFLEYCLMYAIAIE